MNLVVLVICDVVCDGLLCLSVVCSSVLMFILVVGVVIGGLIRRMILFLGGCVW